MGEHEKLGRGGGADGVSRFDGLIGGGASWCSRDVDVPEMCVQCMIATSQNGNIVIIDGGCLVIESNATGVTHLADGK